MRTLAILTLLLIMSILHSNAQEPKEAISKRINLSGYFGAGMSYFGVSNAPNSPSYESIEFRFGLIVNRTLNSILKLKAGLILSTKLKRESYYPAPISLLANYSLDKTASSRTHFSIDIPIMVQVSILKELMNVKIGANLRFWFPNNANVDALTGRNELGLILGLNRNVSKRVNIGAEFYSGLTKIYSYTESSSSTKKANVTNNFLQIGVEYLF